MTQIVSFFSPKTAGATSVSFNAALLHKLINPNLKVAFVEFSAWSSLLFTLPDQAGYTWGEIFPFYKTAEWNQDLLHRLSSSLGADLFWSPLGPDWPVFKPAPARAWFKLLQNEYDLVIFDISAATPRDWQDFATQHSDKLVGVLTPDPISLKAWQQYRLAENSSASTVWLLNQVPSAEKKRLTQKFSLEDASFLGCLRQDESRFWRQCYESQPVAVQKRGKFKKDLVILLPELFSK